LRTSIGAASQQTQGDQTACEEAERTRLGDGVRWRLTAFSHAATRERAAVFVAKVVEEQGLGIQPASEDVVYVSICSRDLDVHVGGE
jgi:hypothetical protein